MKKLVLLLLAVASALCAPAALPPWLSTSAVAELGDWRSEAAVVLLDEHVAKYTAPDKILETRRVVLRVGTPAGRKEADAMMSFDPTTEKVVDARIWIVSADGKKNKGYQRKHFAEDFETFSDTQWDERRILHYDASAEVEVGGVVAWEFQVESSSPITQVGHVFSHQLPVWESRFTVVPLPNMELKWHATAADIGEPTRDAANGGLRWVTKKTAKEPVPTAKEAGFRCRSRLVFVRAELGAANAMDFSSWAGLSAAAAKIVYPKKQADAAIRAKAEELTKDKGERWEKIAALCRYVQKEIRYLAITLDRDYLAGYRPHDAAVVMKNRYGDCKDKTTLLAAMLEAIGETSLGFLVSSGEPLDVPERWPSLSFNHIILAIPAKGEVPASWPVVDCGAQGRFVLFDPTDSVSPLGVLSSADRGGFGLLVAEKDGVLVQVPVEDPTKTGIERSVQSKLDPNGSVQVVVEEIRSGSHGSESYAERVSLRPEAYGRTLETRYHESLPQMEKFTWSDGWEQMESRHKLTLKFEAQKYARRLGTGRLLVVPRLLSANFFLEPMTAGFDYSLVEPFFLRENVRVDLPEGWGIAETPDAITLKQEAALCTITYRLEQNTLVYEAYIVQPGGVLDRAAYDTLRGFTKKVQDAVRRPVVLGKNGG